jgi:hypothetical protein
MQNIVVLMKELNLADDVISNTILKINTLCSSYQTEVFTTRYIMSGNGNGNGDGNN